MVCSTRKLRRGRGVGWWHTPLEKFKNIILHYGLQSKCSVNTRMPHKAKPRVAVPYQILCTAKLQFFKNWPLRSEGLICRLFTIFQTKMFL